MIRGAIVVKAYGKQYTRGTIQGELYKDFKTIYTVLYILYTRGTLSA